MTSLRRIVVSLAILLLAGASHSQTPPQRDPQAVTVLQQVMVAMGASSWSAIRDTRMVAEVISDKRSGPEIKTMRLVTLGSAMWRVDSDDGAHSLASNGRTAVLRDRDQNLQRLPLVAIRYSGTIHLPVLLLLQLEPDVSVEYVGLETVDGTALHHIKVRRKLTQDLGLGEYDAPCELYVNPQTFLVERVTYPVRSTENLRQFQNVEVRYNEYQLMSGVRIPAQLTCWLRGRKLLEQRVVSFLVNQQAKESDFEVTPQ